jgi:hypothetical protein
MRGLLVITVALVFVGSAAHTGADSFTEPQGQWRHSTEATPPKGLGPIEFDMTPARVRELCTGKWELPKPAGNRPNEQTAHCHALPMNLGFEDYQLTFNFYRNKLVSVSLIKTLDGDARLGAFTRAHSSLRAKYGAMPDRIDDYRQSEDPRMQELFDEWGSLYEWRFRRTSVRAEAAKIQLVRFTTATGLSMMLTYDSQRRQDQHDEMSREYAQHTLGGAY